MNKNLKVYKANEIVESTYTLTLNEQRVLLAFISQIDDAKHLHESDTFTLKAKDFAAIFEVSDDRAYSALNETIDKLSTRWIEVDAPNIKTKKIKMRWISSIAYGIDGTGEITLRFSQDILPYLCEFKGRFTCYKLGAISNMTSIYGVRLYELLTQYRAIGKRSFSILWLKECFEVADKYALTGHFVARVITSAVDNINKCSDLRITDVTYQKTGRAITDVVFKFKKKEKAKAIDKQPVVPVKKEKAKVESANDDVQAQIYRENVARFGIAVADKAANASKTMNVGEINKAFNAILKKSKAP